MKLEVMKRGVAAMLCCAVLTAGMRRSETYEQTEEA